VCCIQRSERRRKRGAVEQIYWGPWGFVSGKCCTALFDKIIVRREKERRGESSRLSERKGKSSPRNRKSAPLRGTGSQSSLTRTARLTNSKLNLAKTKNGGEKERESGRSDRYGGKETGTHGCPTSAGTRDGDCSLLYSGKKGTSRRNS